LRENKRCIGYLLNPGHIAISKLNEPLIIMDADKYNLLTNGGEKTLDHEQVMAWAKYSPYAAKLNDAGLTAEGFSKVYTHVVKQMDGEFFDGNYLDFPHLRLWKKCKVF